MSTPNLVLSSDQQKALTEVLIFLQDSTPGNREMAISGSAGTGKTELVKHILSAARSQGTLIGLLSGTPAKANQMECHLTSTTNKAAYVLNVATGEKTRTIHSLLGLRVTNNYSTGKTELKKSSRSAVIDNALIIIDEASMVNFDLLKSIRETTINCKIVYIGDKYQLAPVFENISPVFNEINHQVYLGQIQRQASHSSIIQFAEKFKIALDTGVFPAIKEYPPDVHYVDGPNFQKLITANFGPGLQSVFSNQNKARVVAWSNATVHAYNKFIRALHTPSLEFEIGEIVITNKPILSPKGMRIFATDSLLKITNTESDVVENISGNWTQLNETITLFQPNNPLEVVALSKHYAKNKDWNKFYMIDEKFADLRPFYSSTVNKAQGSTYDDVYIDLNDIGKNRKNHEIARLLYTAITRAKNNVIMYGSLPTRLYA